MLQSLVRGRVAASVSLDWECVVVLLVGVRMVAFRAPSRLCVSCGRLRVFYCVWVRLG